MKNLGALRNYGRHYGPSTSMPLFAAENIRDRAMAENVLWLLRQRYPGRKIIVWAASTHCARNLPSVEVSPEDGGKDFYQGYETMGAWLHRELGADMCALGFSAYEGEYGVGGSWTEKIAPPPAGSLEERLHQEAGDFQYVDYKQARATPGHWLCRPMLADRLDTSASGPKSLMG